MKHAPAGIALLTVLGAVGCADPSRLDAVEANLARVRAEAAVHDRKIEWLRWGQTVLAERSALPGSAPRSAADLTEKIAALKAENAALRTRLDRAERRLDDARPLPDASPRPAHARTLDARVPYELTAAKDPAPEAGDKAPRRTLDETVPY